MFTAVVGLLSFFLLPRTPTSSRFLNEKEKEAIHAALEADWTPDSEDEPFSWSQVIAAFRTPHVSPMKLYLWYYSAYRLYRILRQVLMLSVLSFFGGNVIYGLDFFTPTLTR